MNMGGFNTGMNMNSGMNMNMNMGIYNNPNNMYYGGNPSFGQMNNNMNNNMNTMNTMNTMNNNPYQRPSNTNSTPFDF